MLRGYRGRMITRTRPVVALALSLVALGLLSGCAPQPEPEPTPTAVFASEEEAFKAAEETYRAYSSALNKLNFQELETLEPLAELTTSEYFAQERKSVIEMRAEGIVRGGSAHIEWFAPERYVAGESVTARSCVDNRGTTFVDANGESIVPETRPSHYVLEIDFELSQGRWLVAKSRPTEDPKCPSA